MWLPIQLHLLPYQTTVAVGVAQYGVTTLEVTSGDDGIHVIGRADLYLTFRHHFQTRVFSDNEHALLTFVVGEHGVTRHRQNIGLLFGDHLGFCGTTDEQALALTRHLDFNGEGDFLGT